MENKFAEVRNIEVENIENYMKGLLEEGHDYASACDAVAKAGLAAMYLMSNKLGITGFQASYALWEIIKEWSYPNNKMGMKIVDFDKMLYPQCVNNARTIPVSTWNLLMEDAAKKLKDSSDAHPAVIAHWKKIADGVVPEGYIIESE